MPDYTPNYNFVIPQKYKIDWYNDFVHLINQIDIALKNEETIRQQFDNYLQQLIGQIQQAVSSYYVYIPLRNLTSGMTSYSGTSWIERLNVSAYTKEYFGLPPDNIVEVKYFVYFRARMSGSGQTGYIKSRFRQTTPTGQYVETETETINSTSWMHFSKVVNVPKEVLAPDGLFDAFLMVKVDNGTIQAYMDRAFLLIKMLSAIA